MSDCKAVATPGEVNLKLVKSDDEEQKLVDPKLYRSLVGSLLFIGKQTRPDILHIVNQLSRFLDKPNESHWKAAKHVLRYLKGTIDLRLTFLKNSNSDIIGDSDADWSGDLNDRKSTTGYYFKFEGNGGAISWEVKKQATVARYPDILPKDTLPKDNLPKDILPNEHFADGHLVERTFCRTDSMTSGLFAEKTFCRNDNLPKIEKF